MLSLIQINSGRTHIQRQPPVADKRFRNRQSRLSARCQYCKNDKRHADVQFQK